ncbi:helix-turn-helix domain-containing protein [Streptomyces sp. NEAU-H3]|uniref:helix-turn-helix transcriptional regulator n=1 Tax=Streptomyces sp. NEAU-H3 TaxID=2720636 RepID=UPI001439ECA5|nr:helix-turn-helix domain-containing protein [Streptomyces sp. NEAU-H3]NJA55264.1 helix-turn-helix domain-containing protein [Streptomyces sp. NEAU-H3]
MDRAQLADFLRTRRAALQPEDVGLPRGPRRRTGGLRREEVAALCEMSADYYTRIEQERGPQPSEQMLAAMARGLRLTLAERDHLFLLAGHNAPARTSRTDHITPGLMRILDRLEDTPAQVLSGGGETLKQTHAATALLGDQTLFTGLERSITYRWFAAPGTVRPLYPAEDHTLRGRFFASELRAAYAREGKGGRAEEIAEALLARSEEFAALWAAHEVGLPQTETKRVRHPDLGVLDLYCQVLIDPTQWQSLLVYTATPGTGSHEKLQLLNSLPARAPGA